MKNGREYDVVESFELIFKICSFAEDFFKLINFILKTK